MRAVLDIASPASIAGRVEGQSAFLKSRPALCWAEYEKGYGVLRIEIEERRDGPINRAFVAAYRHEIGAVDESRPESSALS
jgi:predicted component of type VI protein secretion system